LIVASQQEVLYLLRFGCTHRPHPPFMMKVNFNVMGANDKTVTYGRPALNP
jgi:hypothetical protein